MFEIKKINELTFDNVKSFLMEVPNIETVDEDVLKKCIYFI